MNSAGAYKKDRRPGRIAAAVCFIIAVCCFGAALFFLLALRGYGFTSYILGGLGVIMLLFAIFSFFGLKKLRSALAILLTLGVLAVVALTGIVLTEAKTDAEPESKYLIVLGAGLRGTAPSMTLVDRLIAAADYLRQYPESVAIVSGGQGPDELITEAEAMKTWLEAQGIEPERIIMEDRATSTLENLEFSFDIIRSLGDDPSDGVAICSSEYHLYRAKYVAEQLGVPALGVAGETGTFILELNYLVREACAVAYLWVFGG